MSKAAFVKAMVDAVPRGVQGRKRAVPRLKRVIERLESVVAARDQRIDEMLEASGNDRARIEELRKALAELEAE